MPDAITDTRDRAASRTDKISCCNRMYIIMAERKYSMITHKMLCVKGTPCKEEKINGGGAGWGDWIIY